MIGKHVVWGLVVAVAMAGGCGKEEDPANPPASPTPPAPDVTPKTESDAGDTSVTVTPDAQSADGAGDAADAGGDTSITTAPDRKSATAGKGGDGAGGGDAAMAKARQAQEHLSQTAKHLKDQKPDLARKSLAQAEAMQEGLPQTLREEIKTMRANVNSFAKSGTPPVGPADEEEENK